jgi:DNA-binding LacI/PurR family transcriptional regulator
VPPAPGAGPPGVRHTSRVSLPAGVGPAGAPPSLPAIGFVQRRAPFRLGIDPFHTAFLAGMEAAATRAGATVLLQLVADHADELACFRRWAEQGWVRGVVLADLVADDPRLPVLAALGLPVVVLGQEPQGAAVSTVEVDDYGAMRQAVAHLVGLGHSVIGRVTGPVELEHTRARSDAFDLTVGRGGAAGLVLPGDYSTESGDAQTRRLLGGPRRPTAIVYDNDAMAVGGLAAAADLGVSVPRDLSVLAWDDSPLCQLATPPLSVVSRDVPSLGESAARTVLSMIGGRGPMVVRAADSEIVVRGTTAPPPR